MAGNGITESVTSHALPNRNAYCVRCGFNRHDNFGDVNMRSAERTEFLTDLFTTAIENDGYGAFEVHEYEWNVEQPFAIIQFPEDVRQRVTLNSMATGLAVIRNNDKAGFGGEPRTALMLADRTNGEDGDYDVIGALAVLECALFGRVMYA